MTLNTDLRQDDRLSNQTLSLGLTIIAVLASILASSCCLGPLIFVLMGITGAWMVKLTALEPWAPIFSLLAVTALAWSGYLMFRSATGCAWSGGVCELPRPNLTFRRYLAVVILVLGLLLFPLAAPIFY